jgi:sec-independent protein translocase protein TatA
MAQCPIRVNPPFAGRRRAYTARMPFGVGPVELAILVGLLVLVFGAKGVPDIAKRLGTSVREVKGAMDDVDPRRMLEAGDEAATRPPAAPKPRPED